VPGSVARPTLAIVIVSYNARPELNRCLESIASQIDHPPTTIVVVDNGSRDETVTMLRDHWPGVRFIEAGGNIGFARGNNLGIKATESEYVLLLNPDTILASDAISVLIRGLAARPEAAAVGPRLVDEAGRAELSFGWTIGPLGELRQKIVGTLYRQRWTPIVHRVEGWTREAGPREWVSGACLLVRRRDLESVGLLDERYFMYTEDVDLCLALRKRGREILFLPQAEVIHLRGRSAERNPRTEEMRRQSQLAYYAKHHPTWVPFLRLYLRLTGKSAEGQRD
jgi:GT2 family glycosyltransferase